MTDYPRYANSEDRQVELRRIEETAQVDRYKAQMTAETKQAEIAAQDRVDRREHRRVFWGCFGFGLAVVAVIVAIVAAITYGTTRPDELVGERSEIRQIEQQRETACLADGGGWVPADLIEGELGLCVYAGKVAEQ